MKKVSLFNEVFESVDGDIIKFKDVESDKTLSLSAVKYETKVPNLERMCYLMESVLLRKKYEGSVYAGFQKLSRAEEIWDRFLKMADNVDKIYVFGEKDIELTKHPKIQIVPLPPGHPLIREWFLVLDVKLFKNMMVAYDMDGFGQKPVEKDRNFVGAKTVNIKLVDKASSLLQEVINN
jgi:DICT domain-containing protein